MDEQKIIKIKSTGTLRTVSILLKSIFVTMHLCHTEVSEMGHIIINESS